MIVVLFQHVSTLQTVLPMESAWIMMFASAMQAGLEPIVRNTHANTWIIVQVTLLKPFCLSLQLHRLSFAFFLLLVKVFLRVSYVNVFNYVSSRAWTLRGTRRMRMWLWLDWSELRASWLFSCQSVFQEGRLRCKQFVSLLHGIFRCKLQWSGWL